MMIFLACVTIFLFAVGMFLIGVITACEDPHNEPTHPPKDDDR